MRSDKIASSAIEKRKELKKEIGRLNEINETLLSKIDSINTGIEEKQNTIRELENKRNEVAVIYRDKIAAVDSLTDDSVYSRLRARYVGD